MHHARQRHERPVRRDLLAMAAFVGLLHVVGFGLLFGLIVPAHLSLGNGGVFGVGVGLTAYTLGMRHAFDADHIGAIDNVTRKLLAEGERPVSVGFWFSLGHSSVVVVLACALGAGVRGLSGAVDDDASTLHQVTGVLGPSVSGLFLILVGLVNLAALLGVLRVLRRLRAGDLDEDGLRAHLEVRGPLSRLLGPATRAVRRPWHMYPLGVLFGLGFDTATEVALLATAGSAAAGGLPLYAILCLPILFAAGMSLLDTLDGAFMHVAYGWALDQPVRKVFYNLTVTGLSVTVALLIGGIELAQVLADRLTPTGGVWQWIAGLDLEYVGYAIVALFVLTWAGAVAIWRFGDVERRWTHRLGG